MKAVRQCHKISATFDRSLFARPSLLLLLPTVVWKMEVNLTFISRIILMFCLPLKKWTCPYQRSQFSVALATASATASASTKISTLALAISASTISALQYFDSNPSHFHENCNKHQFWRGSSCPQTSASWMLCPFVHFFLDRQKVSLKNTAFLPSLRSITGWHFSAKVSTKVLRKNQHFSASGKLELCDL